MEKILLIDDSDTILEALKLEIEKELSDVEILLACNYKQSNDIIRKNSDIVAAVVDLHLPDASDGKAVLLTSSHNIPTIVLSSTSDELLKKLIMKKDVLDFVHKDTSNSIAYAVSFVKKLVRNMSKTILVVDDSALFRKSFRSDLERMKIKVIEAVDGKDALDVIESHDGEVSMVLTDYNMPHIDGIELTSKLRESYTKAHLGIIALSATEDESALADFLKAGANDFINKPHKYEELNVRVNANLDLLDLFQAASDLANRDFLTGSYNRRYFFEASAAILDKNARKDENIAVATLDIDHFKNVNDTYGHDIGDIAIQEIAKVLEKCLRKSDLVARFGGEEFCMLLENISKEDTQILFEKVRASFEDNEIPLEDGVLKYTVSLGIAYGKSTDINEMIKISDDALYEAKDSGRNRAIIHEK